MVIETREEFLNRIGEKIGDSDEDIAFLEDMTDTYDSLHSGADQETIQRLTAENDELRRKYRERFFKPAENNDDPDDIDDPEPKEKSLSSFDDLFIKEGV